MAMAEPAVKVKVRRLKRVTLTDETYEVVKGMVMNHSIPPGTRVNIDSLARDLEVSQTPIREAMARLESDGLVEKEPLRGYRTTPLLTRPQLDELFDMRLLIEGWSAERAALNITDRGCKQLRAEMATCVAAPTGSEYQAYRDLSEHDVRFHDLIFKLASNSMIRTLWEHSHCHLHLFRLYYAGSLGSSALVEHGVITDAICSGDDEAAVAAMRAHIEASRHRLQPATGQPGGNPPVGDLNRSPNRVASSKKAAAKESRE